MSVTSESLEYPSALSLSDGVLSTAKRYLRSEAEAHDCFQETFIAVFEGIDKFERRSSIGTWIRRITINRCLMRIRAQGRRREEPIDALPDTYRVMLLLRDIDGYSTKEAALIQGISVNAAKTRLHRVRPRLSAQHWTRKSSVRCTRRSRAGRRA